MVRKRIATMVLAVGWREVVAAPAALITSVTDGDDVWVRLATILAGAGPVA